MTMHFVLALHSHLPWVLHHGRWPHGSDWLCEAALDTYLPLIEQLHELEREGTPAPITLGITPVLANQLSHPSFVAEMEHFVAERLRAARQAPAELARTADEGLVPTAQRWLARIERLYALFEALDGDLLGAFGALEDRGRLELMGSAATHGYLPLLARDESIRLQLMLGFAEHKRLFGRAPRGCWLPECAYRPPISDPASRPGIEEHLAAAGFGFFFTDAHLAAAGTPLGAYHDVPLGAERFDAERHDADTDDQRPAVRTPYRAYHVAQPGIGPVRAFVRDPRSSMQVWSRHHGYPGDPWYLEFHKIRWPGGLKLWRVTGPDTDLGDKQRYVPGAAEERTREHARHFASLLEDIMRDQQGVGDVIVAPFDTELFGHWWFEGIEFISESYRSLARSSTVRAATASAHLRRHSGAPRLQLSEGSWGANGDHSMWLNDETRWTWDRLHPLEHRFWAAAPSALEDSVHRAVLAQAARELLLAQASDWQFIISTGAVTDYAEQRFRYHCNQTDRMLRALEQEGSVPPTSMVQDAQELQQRDDIFPDVLDTVEAVLKLTPGATA
jgi:1,4-alpha-glucan branching enzyme